MQVIAKVLTLLASVFLIACTWAPLRLQFHANSNLNLDPEHHSLPVLIRVYQLSSALAFTQASFSELWHSDNAILEDSLLAREELILSPKRSAAIHLHLRSETRYVGIMAVFREHQKTKWRVIIAVPNRIRNLLMPITVKCHHNTLQLVRK